MTQPTNTDTTDITNVPDVGGSQINNDAWTNYVNYLNALTNAQQVANQYGISQAQVQESYAGLQEQAQAAQAQFAVNMAQAKSQYEENVAQFGLDKANDIYQSQLSQAQLALQSAQARQQNAAFQLSQSQANASQRQNQASAYQDVMNMLASRTGPQDEVAYQRLVAGLAAPGAQSSTVLDPLAYVRNMYQPTNIASPNIPNAPTDLSSSFNGLSMPGMTWPSFPSGGNYTAPTISVPNMYGGSLSQPGGYNPATGQLWSGTATGSPVQPGQTQTQPASYTNPQSTAHWMKDANGNWALVSNPAGTNGAPETSGQMVNGGTNQPATTTSTPANAGTTVTGAKTQNVIPGLAFQSKGGATEGPAIAVVGEGTGKEPASTAEIAQALIDAQTGQPVLRVIPANEARPIIDANLVRQHAATGGTYGTALNSNLLTYNSYSPQVLGSQPFYQQLTGQMPSSPFNAFGATVSNPALGIQNAPTNINLRTYNYLDPSQQAGFQSLYGQGLVINPADIVAQAQNAAPTGDYYGYTPLLASHYGG